jgi:hypothetical protein
MPNPNGGPPGSGAIVRRVSMSERAAAYVKARATIAGPRYTKADANRTASTILEAGANDRLIFVTDDMISAIAYLHDARTMCLGEAAQRGLDQLIAALETARD